MRTLRAIGRVLVTALVWLVRVRGHRRARHRAAEPPQEQPPHAPTLVVLALLGAASLCACGFIIFYLVDPSTQLLGLSIGLAFAFLAAASIVAGKTLVPQEELEEEIGERDHPEDRHEAVVIVKSAGRQVSRRGLLLAAAGGTVTICGAALLMPAGSLGPFFEIDRLRQTLWRPGRPLVDAQGRAISADDLAVGSFVTAFAAGADPRGLEASVMVVRLRPDELRLPPERAGWAPEGILAYSKICTHAGCAVSEFDYPTYRPTSPRARLVCPCHYSAFDVADAGNVIAGPAGRPLPQLPLEIEDDRTLVAGGGLSGPPGPSWSTVRS